MEVTTKRTVTDRAILDSLINWSDSGIANFYIEHLDRRPYRMTRGGAGGPSEMLQLPVTVTLQEDCEHDGKLEFVLDRDAIERGLQILAAKHPKVFAQEFPADPDDYDGDAATADLFVQVCLFGEEVFG